jgi:hypothetical protein
MTAAHTYHSHGIFLQPNDLALHNTLRTATTTSYTYKYTIHAVTYLQLDKKARMEGESFQDKINDDEHVRRLLVNLVVATFRVKARIPQH